MLYSISVYATTFAISIFGLSRYQKNMDRKNMENIHIRGERRLENLFWIVLILLPPVLIAAFRASNVGTDYLSYQRIFNAIKRYSLKEYMQYKGTITFNIEYGYWCICRIVYRLGGSFIWANFISEFLIIFFMWRGLVWFHKKYDINMALGMYLFYMIQYGYGLNGIRFSIGAAICFYALKFLLEKKPLLYILVCLFALLFHNIIFIALLFYAVNIFNNKTMKKPALTVILIAFFLIIIELDELLRLISRFTFLERYFNNYGINESAAYGWGIWLFVIPLFIPLIFFWRKARKKSEKIQILFILTLLYIPFRFLGYYNQWISRPLRLAELYLCAAVPCLIAAVDSNKNKKLLKLYYISFSLVWYVFNYVILNASKTYPFAWISLGGGN